MAKQTTVLPKIVTRREWLAERKTLLEKEKKNWNFPFYSSRNSDFNYDFQATIDPNRNHEYYFQ